MLSQPHRGARPSGAHRYALTFGRELGSPEPVDLEESRLIVFVGSHLNENAFTPQITAFAAGLSRGAKLVVVDPRFSTAASRADWWLPIRPGTDVALLLAWMNVLIGEGLYDREYIAKYAQAFAELAAHVREFTPEWAEPITELPASQIRETARDGRGETRGGDPPGQARHLVRRRHAARAPWPFSPRWSAAGDARAASSCRPRFPLASEELGVTNGLVGTTLSGHEAQQVTEQIGDSGRSDRARR